MKMKSKAPVRIDFAGGWTDVPIFAEAAGGAVLNAALAQYVYGELETGEDGNGIRVSYQSDLPAGSGLGTSSALNVVWLSLVQSRISSREDRKRLAELAFQLESVLGILGGKQDQYAAALGGINLMRFHDSVEIEPVELDPQAVATLESRLVLCYTGQSRLSGNIHESVWGAFRAGKEDTVRSLYRLRAIALEMTSSLRESDWDAFGAFLSENWECQKCLDDSVTNERIESLFRLALANGAIGGKAGGAGGGGCLVFFAEEGRGQELTAALEAQKVRIIPSKLDLQGLTISRE
jgi:D-glycero-alpha-D-manno-heptose-7-phosphate kinase